MRYIIRTKGTYDTAGGRILLNPWCPVIQQEKCERDEFKLIGPMPENPSLLKRMARMTQVGSKTKVKISKKDIRVAHKAAGNDVISGTTVASYSFNTECREKGVLIKRGKYLIKEDLEGTLILTDRDGIRCPNPKPIMIRAMKRMKVATDEQLDKYGSKTGIRRIAQRLVRKLAEPTTA